MTDKLKIFNYDIVKHKVPIHLYNDSLLKEDIINIFSKKEILEHGGNSKEVIGKAHSTCGFGNHYVTNLKNINPLVNYISKIILKKFYDNIKNGKIIYYRIWMNKIYKNCSGKCHTHDEYEGNHDGTAIFYFNVPENGSKLIILKDNIQSSVTKEHKDISHYIEVKSGDLIIHSKNLPHAFSKHMNDDPRICFVFDFGISNNFNFNYT